MCEEKHTPCTLQTNVVQHVDKSDSVSAIFPIYFIWNHLFRLLLAKEFCQIYFTFTSRRKCETCIWRAHGRPNNSKLDEEGGCYTIPMCYIWMSVDIIPLSFNHINHNGHDRIAGDYASTYVFNMYHQNKIDFSVPTLDLRCLFSYLYYRQYIDRRTQIPKSEGIFSNKRKIWK
jgi:hypothetical protein